MDFKAASVQCVRKENDEYITTRIGETVFLLGGPFNGLEPADPSVYVFYDVPPEFAKNRIGPGRAYVIDDGEWKFIRKVDTTLPESDVALLFGVSSAERHSKVPTKYPYWSITLNEKLIHAASKLDLKMVNYFIDKGADVNAKDNLGHTALMDAVERGDIAIVRALLSNGADINAKDNLGHTALMRAVEGSNIALMKALLSHGADVSASNGRFRTALMFADSADVARVLLDKAPDLKARDDMGWTALFAPPSKVTPMSCVCSSKRGLTQMRRMIEGGRP